MPHCHLSQDFLNTLLFSHPQKIVQYRDNDLPHFLLEYRPTGSGTWYFRYKDALQRIRYFRLGTLKDMNAVQARERAYAVRALLAKGGDPHKSADFLLKVPTLLSFVENQYLPQAKRRKRSWAQDKYFLSQYILPVFGAREVDSIRYDELVEWQNSLGEKGLAPSSCNRIVAVLRAVFSMCVLWGVVASATNPCRYLIPFSDMASRERFLSIEEAKQVLHELDKFPNNQSAQVIKLLLFTGARRSEILSARWENINLQSRILTVPLSKSGKARYIPLSDEALAIIEKLPRTSAWLFPAAKGEGHLSTPYYLWDKIRTQLGLKDVRIHDLRHSFASFLVNGGCSLYEVQRILGHSDPKMTMRYAHLAQASLISAANTVGQFVFSHPKKRKPTQHKAQALANYSPHQAAMFRKE